MYTVLKLIDLLAQKLYTILFHSLFYLLHTYKNKWVSSILCI